MNKCIDIMSDRIEFLTRIIKESNIPILGNTDKYFMWNLCCVDYFYYNCNIGSRDIKNHWTDGTGDGGIDYVFDDGKNMYLIQGKYGKQNLNDIKSIVYMMEDTIDIFSKGMEVKYNLNEKLKKAYKNAINNKTRKNIKLVLFTNTSIKDKLKEEINEWKKNREFDITIYGSDEIEKTAVDVENGEKTVDKGFLECADDNVLKYSCNKNSGIIVSIRAKSLQDLYSKKKDFGLFGYNLREQIKDSKLEVDDSIKKTIAEEKENFWFYNNGITIGCESFKLQGNKLILYNFSIINGAQTTTIIGKSPNIDNENDFSIVCKVVKTPGSLESEFIKNISKASNSQKEIGPRDLYSNNYEQKLLQYRFSKNKNKIAVTIKRGKRPNIYNSVKREWEKIENIKLAQIILATILQKPGTARSSPNYIFGNTKIYNSIFDKDIVSNYNYNALYDIIRLQYYYEKYKARSIKVRKNKLLAMKKSNDQAEKMKEENQILGNSGFTVAAIIIYMIKRKYFNVSKINSESDENWEKFVKKEINTDLSLNYRNKTRNKNEYKCNLEIIFDEIIKKLIKIYHDEKAKPDSVVEVPSNFFKTDSIYRKLIIPAVDEIIEKEPNNIIFDKLEMFNDKKNKESI